MSKNEINIKINVSDDLLSKFMSAMVASQQSPLPMIAGMLPMTAPPSEDDEKAPIGFNRQATARDKEG